ncbi:hypothetical protein RF11_06685 [Thelohanellus kitauei]|uniref:Uncharacterized protein n=1 Tax=Thelohanellus kitauei TaxID=669202 RepID=A0A0C2NLA6_THEKT|nr:hypothetical protein RF11_06685 [Thelohanellus kitauei]
MASVLGSLALWAIAQTVFEQANLINPYFAAILDYIVQATRDLTRHFGLQSARLIGGRIRLGMLTAGVVTELCKWPSHLARGSFNGRSSVDLQHRQRSYRYKPVEVRA